MPLEGRILHLSLDVTVIPPQEGATGNADVAFDLSKRLALETGLLAQRLAPEGSRVEVERQIVVY